MPSPIATPTPITPPRVPFIDQRTGLIDRAWYLFFLSLFSIAQSSEDWNKGSDVNSLLASYDSALQKLSEFVETKPIQELQSQIAELEKQVEGLQMNPPPRHFKRSRYGQFLDTTTQTAAAINTAYAITYNTTDVSNGVYLGSPSSRIYVDEEAIYNFIFSIQIDKTAGGVGAFWIWPSVNGTDVPNSASQMRIQGNNAEIFSAACFFLELAAGDYVEFKFAVDDTTVELKNFPASAFYPAIPSIIVTVTNNIEGVQ